MNRSNVVCPQCGKPLLADSDFCQFCGYNLAHENTYSLNKLIRENEMHTKDEINAAIFKRMEAVQAAEKRKKIIKAIIGVIVGILIATFITVEIQRSHNNAQLRNFATESMSEDYTNVYADVVSIEPVYFVYRQKENKYGTPIGAQEIWDVVCKCKTIEGKTIWASVFYPYYPGGGAFSDEADYKAMTYGLNNPKRIIGAVDTARQVIPELENKIGDIYVLDVRDEIT